MASKIYTQEQFITAVKNSHSYSEVCRQIGISPKGGNLKTVKNKILELNLDMSHFTGARWNRGETSEIHPSIKKKDISEILVENSGWSSGNLRKRLIKEGLKEAKCECCGKTDWLGVPIPLELHHINGIHTDNRLQNLLVLCPNCHAMTDSHLDIEKLSTLIKNQQIEGSKIQESLVTKYNKMVAEKTIQDNPSQSKILEPKYCQYCGKELLKEQRRNKYCSLECAHKANGSKRPDMLILLEDFKELKSFVQVGKKYGVTDNAVRKWCSLYGILDRVKN